MKSWPSIAERGATSLMWVVALGTVAGVSRYFFWSAERLAAFEDSGAEALARFANNAAILTVHPFNYHPALLRIHVACGMLAMTAGLFQFLPGLRARHPRVHRATGYSYFAAVIFGSVAASPLSFLFFSPLPPAIRARLLPTSISFFVLGIVWVSMTTLAVVRARQMDFDQHRAWMLRSYSLTFAAVTTRLAAPLLLLLTGDAVWTTNLAINTWPLNLLFAEWLIRRAGTRAKFAATA